MERMWIRESSFDIEKQVWRCWVGGGGGVEAQILCVCLGGFEKSVSSRGRVKNLAIELRAWSHEPGLLLWRDLSTLVERNKNHLCDYMTTEPARLAQIPVLWCRDPRWIWVNTLAGRPGEWTTAGNTVFMHIASNLYIKMAALGWPFSCNTRIKVTLAELASPTNQASLALVIKPLLWVVLSRSLHVKDLEFAAFVREYDLI